MPPTITLKITDNADRQLAVLSVPVPLSGSRASAPCSTPNDSNDCSKRVA